MGSSSSVVSGAQPLAMPWVGPVITDSDEEYAALFGREFAKVARTVLLVVHDRERAEELAQEAFIQLLMHWEKVSTYDVPEAWVRRVAIRLAIRNSRRERLRSVLEREAVKTRLPADASIDVTDALQQLPVAQRAAVVLHYYEGRPIYEVADILACSQNTVKSHLHRGRNRLKVLVGDQQAGRHGA